MTETKFTPGPWRIQSKGGTQDILAGPDYFTRIMVAFTGGGVGIPSEANAHLIAAAPDLYEALEHIVGGALSLPRFAEEEARAALARARGEQS